MKRFSSLFTRLAGDDRLKARLFSKGLADLTVKGVGLFALFGMNAVLARIMGVEAFGHFAFVSSAVLVASLLARQGMDSGALRLVPGYIARQEWGLLNGMLRWMLIWVAGVSAVIGMGVVLALVVFSDRVPAGLFETALWGALLLPFTTVLYQLQYILRSRGWMVRAQVPDLVWRPIGISALVALAWYVGWPVAGHHAMAFAVGITFFGLLAGWMWLRQSMPDQVRAASGVLAQAQWRRVSTPLLFVAGANMLLTQIDILMLGLFQTTDASGIYTIASRLAAMSIFATIALGSFGAPLVAELYAEKKLDDLARIIKTMARVAIVCLVPAVIFFVFFGEWILALFGAEFVAAYVPLMVLMGGQALAACFGASAIVLTMTEHEDLAARVLVGSVVANVALNALLIPPFAMEGAAIATALTTALPVALMSFLAKKHVGINSTVF